MPPRELEDYEDDAVNGEEDRVGTTGAELTRLDHGVTVNAVAFSPDGTRVTTASGDQSARVWVVDHHQLIEQAEARMTRNLTQQEWRRFFPGEPYRKTRADLP